jgi:hypothetical protein
MPRTNFDVDRHRSAENRSPALEATFLGSVMAMPKLWKDGLVTIDDFTTPLNQKVLRFLEREENRDLASVCAGMRAAGSITDADIPTISGLLDGQVSPESLDTTAAGLRELTRKRTSLAAFDWLRQAMEENDLDGAREAGEEFLHSLRPRIATEESPLEVIRGDQVEETALRWSWKRYLPLGKLVHFGGNSSQAKSPVTVDIAARFSSGTAWPDGTPNEHGPLSVIILNIEDDFQDTILPRFRLAGGRKEKLHYVRGTKVTGDSCRGLALDRDTEHLVQLAKSLPDLGLIIIDPITNYLGKYKMNSEEDVRAALTPLAAMAADLGIVVITVGHLNRREKGTDPLHRMLGAAAFSGVARAVYAFGPDPDDRSPYAHVMTTVRGCGGDGDALRYRTELVTNISSSGFTTEIIKVYWTGKSDASAADSIDSVSTGEKTQEAEAGVLLRNLLSDGRKPAKECTSALLAEGYDVNKLNAGRVRRKAGAESNKFPGETFYSWFLPSEGGQLPLEGDSLCSCQPRLPEKINPSKYI